MVLMKLSVLRTYFFLNGFWSHCERLLAGHDNMIENGLGEARTENSEAAATLLLVAAACIPMPFSRR